MRLFASAIMASLMVSVPQGAYAEAIASTTVERSGLIADVERALRANYVFADKVDAIVSGLRAKEAAGAYSQAADASALAELLSRDLIDATGDYHFFLAHDPKPATEEDKPFDDGGARRKSNFDFKKLEILPGNIGYMRFDYFANPDDAFQTMLAALRFVENSDALIVDMRYNRGGHLGTAQLLMSHLFSGEKDRQLFDYFYNEDGAVVKRGMWVMHGVPGKRMLDVPVYVLTSTTTFSAGEWLSYSLGELGRATIVGRRTAGAAHPVNLVRVNDDFTMQVPVGVIHGPVSGTDFEGKGVVPDRDVPSHDALAEAYRMALTALGRNDPSGNADWFLGSIPVSGVSPDEVARDTHDIVGSYEGRSVALRDGTLIYSWRDRFALALTPLGGGLFAVEGTQDYRIRLLRDGRKVTGLAREFMDGSQGVYRRIRK